jgi:BNR repeat-like domain
VARHARPRSRLVLVPVVVVAVMALAAARLWVMNRPAADPGPLEARGGGHVVDQSQELAEQQEITTERVEAYEQALANGRAGQTRPAGSAAARGWVGEQPYDNMPDDWEPAIAADPHSQYVYALATRYGTAKPCPTASDCPVPYIVLKVSADNGATWTPSTALCACKGGKGQFDPIIEVVPNTGEVYALFMGGGGNGFNVFFTKSNDHGKTWTTPVGVYGNVAWEDKPIIAVSDDGKHVYASFNGPTGGDPYIAQSRDAGATWAQTKLIDSKRYTYAFDGDVAPDGTVYFAESALQYSGKTAVTGNIEHHVFVSTDRGLSFSDHVIATVQVGMDCVAAGCKPDFYIGHDALSVDKDGGVTVAYDGATVFHGPQTIAVRHSGDHGTTWSTPVTVSTVGEMATSPAMEAGAAGDVRLWWMETNGGNVDAWNVWYRKSIDGGATWSTAVKLSDAAGGAVYKSAAGFAEVYGDYGEMAITSAGKSIAIWGEGISYTGPGGIWFNRER